MFSNKLAFTVLGAACIIAAGAGGYLALRQNTTPPAPAAIAPSADSTRCSVRRAPRPGNRSHRVAGARRRSRHQQGPPRRRPRPGATSGPRRLRRPAPSPRLPRNAAGRATPRPSAQAPAAVPPPEPAAPQPARPLETVERFGQEPSLLPEPPQKRVLRGARRLGRFRHRPAERDDRHERSRAGRRSRRSARHPRREGRQPRGDSGRRARAGHRVAGRARRQVQGARADRHPVPDGRAGRRHAAADFDRRRDSRRLVAGQRHRQEDGRRRPWPGPSWAPSSAAGRARPSAAWPAQAPARASWRPATAASPRCTRANR